MRNKKKRKKLKILNLETKETISTEERFIGGGWWWRAGGLAGGVGEWLQFSLVLFVCH